MTQIQSTEPKARVVSYCQWCGPHVLWRLDSLLAHEKIDLADVRKASAIGCM
jgi:hypothetical protein